MGPIWWALFVCSHVWQFGANASPGPNKKLIFIIDIVIFCDTMCDMNNEQHNMYQQIVRVHRRGRDPDKSSRPEIATSDIDGRLYVRCRVSRRWWMLSNDNGGRGWRSMNVGICDEQIIARLNDREKSKKLP